MKLTIKFDGKYLIFIRVSTPSQLSSTSRKPIKKFKNNETIAKDDKILRIMRFWCGCNPIKRKQTLVNFRILAGSNLLFEILDILKHKTRLLD